MFNEMGHGALDGIEVLLIDGNNLLHRVTGSVEPDAQRTLLPRLRALLPPTIATVMMLDGHADVGTSRTEKIAHGFEIRHSGSISADDALLHIVRNHEPGDRHEITVVSDDRALSDRVRHLGARTQRLAWLTNLLESPSARTTTIGSGRRPVDAAARHENGDEREPWRPGRGATTKRGNSRRKGRPGRGPSRG
jgi:rRNA-processing protein FCF1